MIFILYPTVANTPAPVGGPRRLTARFVGFPPPPFDDGNNAVWSAPRGSFSNQQNASDSSTVIYTPDINVLGGDASSNKTFDVVTITCTDSITGNFATIDLVVVPEAVALPCTVPLGRLADGESVPRTDPSCTPQPSGNAANIQLVGGNVTAADNSMQGEASCDPAVDSMSDGCGCKTCTPGMAMPELATSEGTSAAILKADPVICNKYEQARLSRILTTLPGMLMVKTECGVLRTRGEPLELCTTFTSYQDPFATAQIAGIKRSFGWEARLIIDASNGNVAIYWGDRRVEAWTNSGGTFTATPGTFGTLVLANNTYTRTTKDCVYYDFDSNGRLQKIHDRSVDGNFIYYNYNGSNQMIRIVGPGLGFKPYFTYDANGRVNLMSLEGSDSTKNRATYYDYDGSGRMNKIIGPENCVTYFDYDGNSNLSLEIDPDNYRAYFQYETIGGFPRIREINLPESAGLYFTYDDSFPRQTKVEAGCGTTHYYDYDWTGQAGENDNTYFKYDSNGKPIFASGSDGSTTQWAWDANGNMITTTDCESQSEQFTYGDCGTLTSRYDKLGRITYWDYDSNNYQKDWKDALGNTTYFERDSYGQLVSVKDRRGNTTYYTHDTRGNLTSVKWPDATVRYFDYTDAGEIEKQIDELGNATYYDHDKRGRITKWKDFLGQETQYAFDNRSNRTIVVDRRGHNWYWDYDGLSRTIRRKTPLGNTASMQYTPCNLMSSSVDPRGNPAYFYYDSNQRLSCRENALQERTYYTYTAAGQVESVKNARGYSQYFVYNCHHLQTSMKDEVGNVTTYEYDAMDNRDAVTDPRGNVTYTNYDELYRVVSTRNPLLQQEYFYYDVESNRTCAEDALQRRSYFYYDSLDRQFCAEDALQQRTYFTYEARGLRSSVKDARGNVGYFYQDKLARQFAVRDARNNLAYTEYDAESNVVASKDPRSNTTYFAFDFDNRQFAVQTPSNEFTYFTFDAAANRISVKDPRSNPSYFYFDVLNRTFCSEDAKQARTYFTFDAAGNRTTVKDPLARVTTVGFDAANRQQSVLDAAGGARYFTYDASSNNDSVKDERANVTYLYFDALNRNFSSRNPLQALVYFEFDAVGNRFAVKDPIGRFNYFYFDAIHRLKASEDGLQRRTYFEYDAVGNTVSVKNARRSTVTPAEVGVQYFTFDELNRRNSLKTETANVWYFDYDAASNLFVQRNPLGAFTYWEYDADNRKQSQKDPLARTWYWTYDLASNVSSMKDGKAQVTSYQFDAVNLNDRIDYPDGIKHYFEYDLARQRTAMADPSGRTVFSFDSLGRLTIRQNPGSENLYYEYDATSNRTTLKDPAGTPAYYSFDSVNRLFQVRANGYNLVSYYEYDLADQMLLERHGNTTLTYHGYDAAGRISLIQHRQLDGTLVESWEYTRDEAGNPTLLVRGSDSMRQYFNYDPANRITREAWRSSGGTDIYGWTYEYDAASNRNRKTNPAGAHIYWNHDLADQLVIQKHDATTKVDFTFDANGNLSVENDADAGRTYYDYDPRNLLVRVDFPGGTATNYFEFNAAGERIRKDDSTGGKKYTWDGLGVVLEKDLGGSVTQRLIKGQTPVSGIGDYALQDVGGTVLTPHKNQVGTTMRHTNAAATLTNTYEYDAWGQPLVTTQGTAQQMRFNSKELDPDFVDFNSVNRRIHYLARTYVPFRGSFVQVDPLLNDSRRQLAVTQAYALPVPTFAMDPTGLQDASGHLRLAKVNNCIADCVQLFSFVLRECAKLPTALEVRTCTEDNMLRLQYCIARCHGGTFYLNPPENAISRRVQLCGCRICVVTNTTPHSDVQVQDCWGRMFMYRGGPTEGYGTAAATGWLTVDRVTIYDVPTRVPNQDGEALCKDAPCDACDCIAHEVAGWPMIPYSLLDMNSNSAAAYLVTKCGLAELAKKVGKYGRDALVDRYNQRGTILEK